MKCILCILLVHLCSIVSYGQQVAFQLDKMNLLYTCVENPYTIVVDGYSPKDLILSIDNGEIKPIYPWGGGVIVPQNAGFATVSVKIKTQNGLKELKKIEFRVRPRPLPEARINGKNGGEISKAMLCKQKALISSCGHGPRYVVLGFKVIVRRGNVEIFSHKMAESKDAEIDSFTNSFFQTLKENDKVIFADILVEECDSVGVYIEPMTFIISETQYEPKDPPLPEQYYLMFIDPITGKEVKVRKKY